MTDRELLELAAKAAGAKWIDQNWPEDLPGVMLDFGQGTASWNPLTDDGDALRLAVKLNLAIRPLEKCVFVESDPETLLGQSQYSELEMFANHPDHYAATRRAIVRAAVEIGRNME